MDNSSLMAWAGSIVTIITGIAAVQKVLKNLEKSRSEHNALILQAAKEEISTIRRKLEIRILSLEGDLDSLRDSVNKDLAHVKETHGNELENVGEKIQEIRQELRDQHSQILQLLTALIENRE